MFAPSCNILSLSIYIYIFHAWGYFKIILVSYWLPTWLASYMGVPAGSFVKFLIYSQNVKISLVSKQNIIWPLGDTNFIERCNYCGYSASIYGTWCILKARVVIDIITYKLIFIMRKRSSLLTSTIHASNHNNVLGVICFPSFFFFCFFFVFFLVFFFIFFVLYIFF